MGLEITELFMWVEDTFKIEIDDEAVNIATVGELHRYVLERLSVPWPDRKCPTPKAFLMLRRTLSDHLGVPEKSITTSTRMADLIPLGRRQAVWKQLKKAHEWRFPSLEEPGFIVIVAGLLCTLGLAGWVFLWAPAIDIRNGPLLSFLALTGMFGSASLAFVVFVKVLAPLTWRFPCATVGETAQYVASVNRNAILYPGGAPKWAPDSATVAPQLSALPCAKPSIFLELRTALMEQFGLSKDKISLEQKMALLVPRRRRQAQWRALGEVLNWRLPDLERPGSLVFGSVLLWFVAGTCMGLLVAGYTGWPIGVGIVPVLLLTALPYAYIAAKVTKPLQIRFNKNARTLADLLETIVLLRFDRVSSIGCGLNEHEVWNAIKQRIVDGFGVKPEHVTEDTRFVDDLGFG